MPEIKIYVTDKKNGVETQGGFMAKIEFPPISDTLKISVEELMKPLLEQTTNTLSVILFNVLGDFAAQMEAKEIAIPFGEFMHVMNAFNSRMRRRVMRQITDSLGKLGGEDK